MPRERDHTIELSDKEHLEKLRPISSEPLKVSKEFEEAGLIYKRPGNQEDSMSPALKEKFELARKLCKDTQIIDLKDSNAKSKSKSAKSKSKKVSAKSNKTAMASL